MKPETRIENFLAKIAGNSDAKEMEPKTRVEHFLNDIAENGGSGGDIKISTKRVDGFSTLAINRINNVVQISGTVLTTEISNFGNNKIPYGYQPYANAEGICFTEPGGEFVCAVAASPDGQLRLNGTPSTNLSFVHVVYPTAQEFPAGE